MSFPVIVLPDLPPNTVVPESEDLFDPYLNRLYEDVAFAVNNRDFIYFPIPVTDTAANIPNVPNFGSFVLCISGANTAFPASTLTGSTLPTLIVACTKADATAAGVVAVLGAQVGTGTWAGKALTVSSTATNFQINHDRAGMIGNFNIRILGTQM